MPKFGFVGPTYTLQTKIADAERSINLYPEVIESGQGKGGAKVYLVGTPGYQALLNLPDQPLRGLYSGDGVRLFAISGRTLYECFQNGSFTQLGQVAASDAVNRATFTANGNSLLVASGANLYAYNGPGSWGSVLPAVMVVYIDGYSIVLDPGLKQFGISSLFGGGAAGDWDPTWISGAQGESSDMLSIIANYRELWIFKERSIEVWDDVGAQNLPFARNPAGFIEQGCVAQASPTRLDNTIFWLGGDERGAGVIWRAEGYTPERISNHAVETAMLSYPKITDAEFYGQQMGGHSFLVCHFPSANPSPFGGAAGATWVYDCAASAQLGTPQWHERAYWDPIRGLWNMHRGRVHAYCWGMHLIGDWYTGKIYQLSPQFRQDDGNPLRWLRSAPHIADSMAKISYREFWLDMQVGVGLANSINVTNTQTSPDAAIGINYSIAQMNAATNQPVVIGAAGQNPMVELRWSNDGGNRWHGPRLGSAGAIGKYGTRLRWMRMGSARDRVFECSGSDPVPVALLNAEFNPTTGAYQ
jgi:hypothetical protein